MPVRMQGGVVTQTWSPDVKIVSLEASRRNRNNRKKGRRTSAELADYLSAQDVEQRGFKWDVQHPAFRLQSKRDGTARSAGMRRQIIEAIYPGDYLRGLYLVEPRQRLTSGTVTLLLEEWVAERGWFLPPGELLHGGKPLLVLDLPHFRDLVVGLTGANAPDTVTADG